MTLTFETWTWVRSRHSLGSWTIVRSIIKTQLGVRSYIYGSHTDLGYVHCEVDLDMTFGQDHDISLGHRQQLFEILYRSNLAVSSYGPDKDLRYTNVWTVTLNFWDMTVCEGHGTPLGHWIFVWNIHIQLCRMRILSLCAPWPWKYELVSRSWHIHGLRTTMCEILSRSNLAIRSYGPDKDFSYVLIVILAFDNLGLRSWHTIGLRPTIVWNNIQIQLSNKKRRPGQGF